MNTELMFIFTLGCLLVAIIVGAILRRLVPEQHRAGETKDTVRLATGFLATMTALVLGLLLSSAKESYDTVRREVTEMSAKITFIDRILEAYGPDAAETRTLFRAAVEEAIEGMWPTGPTKLTRPTPDLRSANAVYAAIQRLTPQDDIHRDLKNQASGLAIELGQLRTLLITQLVSSISRPMLMVLVYWLAIIFLSFSLLAPSNSTATLALLISAFSVASAVFMILELDRPFDGFVKVSNQPMINALPKLGN